MWCCRSGGPHLLATDAGYNRLCKLKCNATADRFTSHLCRAAHHGCDAIHGLAQRGAAGAGTPHTGRPPRTLRGTPRRSPLRSPSRRRSRRAAKALLTTMPLALASGGRGRQAQGQVQAPREEHPLPLARAACAGASTLTPVRRCSAFPNVTGCRFKKTFLYVPLQVPACSP